VVALAVPPGHDLMADEAWGPGTGEAWLFHVESIPVRVRQRLALLAPWYRPARGFAGEPEREGDSAGPCWRNHCEHCDAPLDDHDLHCEPGGAFAPAVTLAVAGAVLRIVRWDVDEPLEVVAGGYGEDPSA
jgi:hypothetical protein